MDRCLMNLEILTVLIVGSGLCGQRLRARDESALEVAPWHRRTAGLTAGLRRSRRCAIQIDSLFYLFMKTILFSGYNSVSSALAVIFIMRCAI